MKKQRTEQAFPLDPGPASVEEAGFCHLDGTAPAGRVTYASGEQQEFTDPEAYLQTIREELPYQNTTGFRFETLTDDPALRKAVDDLLLDFAGEENPRRACNYGLTEAGKRALGAVSDPERPHTYAWFVLTACGLREEVVPNLTLEEAIRLYQESSHPEKRLGVAKDGIAAVDLVWSLGGRQEFFRDHQRLEHFRADPVVSLAAERLRRELTRQTPQQGMTMGGI